MGSICGRHARGRNPIRGYIDGLTLSAILYIRISNYTIVCGHGSEHAYDIVSEKHINMKKPNNALLRTSHNVRRPENADVGDKK